MLESGKSYRSPVLIINKNSLVNELDLDFIEEKT